jgi:uncharacterized membrane protein YedE/YeeE
LLTAWAVSDHYGKLFITGFLIGLVFIHFHFGFTGYWRQFWMEQKTLGTRCHLWLLALGALVFFPAIHLLPEWGLPVSGAIRPIGLNVAIGAFLFGIGMALANSCSSGTIRLLGEFKMRYYWVFLWMIIGGTLAASHLEIWLSLNTWGRFSLATDLPWTLGLVIHLAIITLLYWALIQYEKRHHTQVAPLFTSQASMTGVKIAPTFWAPFWLVLLNLTILILSAYPWAISWIFPKLGLLAIQQFDLPIEWEFWEFSATHEAALAQAWSKDTIVLTTLGMFTGVASYRLSQQMITHKTWPKLTRPVGHISFTTSMRLLVAGLLLGYGATLSFGCNIGGFFSAIISGSLHGWLWVISAFSGFGLTLLIKRFFRPSNLAT